LDVIEVSSLPSRISGIEQGFWQQPRFLVASRLKPHESDGGTNLLYRLMVRGFMAIHDLPKKWRDRAHGDAAVLACADDLEAHLKDVVLGHVSPELEEIHFALIVPEAVFKAMMRKTTSCTLSTKSRDMRRATLVFT